MSLENPNVRDRMLTRIIPRLDIKGPNLVKGIRLEGLRVLGKPEFFAEFYNRHGADELMFVDVVASLYGRNNALDIVRRTAGKIFIPLTVGGGIRSVDDIAEVLRAGADKVSLNTAAIGDPSIIRRAARRFGSSTIVVTVEAIRQPDGSWEAFTDNGRERTGRNAVEWAVEAVERGAGELVVTSIDREGTGQGFDTELVRSIAERVGVPVIAHGGAGSSEDVRQVLAEGGASAVALASILHYHVTQHHDPAHGQDFDDVINLAHLKAPGSRSHADTSLPELKAILGRAGFRSRLAVAEIAE